MADDDADQLRRVALVGPMAEAMSGLPVPPKYALESEALLPTLVFMHGKPIVRTRPFDRSKASPLWHQPPLADMGYMQSGEQISSRLIDAHKALHEASIKGPADPNYRKVRAQFIAILIERMRDEDSVSIARWRLRHFDAAGGMLSVRPSISRRISS